MQTKHTPGPWEVSWNTFNRGEAHGIYANGEMDLKGFQIATVNYYPTMNNEANEETGNANARLIAAAPDLLEALAFCQSVIKSQGLWDRSEQIAFEKATNAIEKATGSLQGPSLVEADEDRPE